MDTIAVEGGPFNLTLVLGPLGLEGETPLPTSLALRQNYPNPFNPATTIPFDLPERTRLSLSIYDLRGREIAQLFSGEMPPGSHAVVWQGQDGQGRTMSSGIYIARLSTPAVVRTIKVLLIK